MSENYLGIMMRIISGNYDLVYNITWISHGKVEIYRDTGVYKKKLSECVNYVNSWEVDVAIDN